MKVVLADDHHIVRSGVAKLILQNFHNVECSEARSGSEVIEKLTGNDYQLLVLDVNMPEVGNVKFITEVLNASPDVKVVIFSMLDEKLFGIPFLKAGAHAFVNKASESVVLVQAILAVLEGRRFLTNAISQKLLEDSILSPNSVNNGFEDLSEREFEILLLMFDGYVNKEISAMLDIAVTSVSTYRSRIFDKLGTNNIFHIRDLYYLTYNNR